MTQRPPSAPGPVTAALAIKQRGEVVRDLGAPLIGDETIEVRIRADLTARSR